jgi:hypothetical protein
MTFVHIILCWLGWHVWEPDPQVDPYWDVKRCRHCHQGAEL